MMLYGLMCAMWHAVKGLCVVRCPVQHVSTMCLSLDRCEHCVCRVRTLCSRCVTTEEKGNLSGFVLSFRFFVALSFVEIYFLND